MISQPATLITLIRKIQSELFGQNNGFTLAMMLMLFPIVCPASVELPPMIGNFTLPPSQQPGALISFGQNIINEHETELALFADNYMGKNKHFADLIPGVIYGITPNLSIFVNAPYAVSYQSDQQKSSGWEDAFAQLEYAFYNGSTKQYIDQATVVANISVPTGSVNKNPATGAGAPSYFLGLTFDRMYVDWLIFGSPGVGIPTAKNGTKFGNSFLYQFGFGRRIAAHRKNWLFAWIIEIDGTYTQKNRVKGSEDQNSGGNVVYVTPSLWTSTNNFIFQLGVGFPATQHLYGNQTRDTWLLAANIAFSFY